jgi:EmrB/QacA subfamily drug resistance transporter
MSASTPSARLRLVLAAMTLANAMILVDQTAVPLALPDVMSTFGIGSQEVQWVLNGSLLPLAGLLVFGGSLGDLLGRRRVFLIGAVTFATASAVGGLAPEFWVLLVARVAQGCGGALMLPATVAIVSSTFPPQERGKALGTMGGAAAVFAALGPTIGGLLTSAFSWRAVLLINVPIAVGAVLLTLRHVPADPPAPSPRPKIDAAGAALLSLALIGVILGLSQSESRGWSSPAVLAALGVAALAAVAFVVRETRIPAPLLDFGLLRERNYAGATLSQFLAGMAEIGLGVIFPLLLILNLRMSPALAGIALIPTTLPMIVVAPLAGRWYDRTGGRPPLVTGFVLLALSGIVLSLGVAARSYAALLPGLLLYGLGLALVLTVNDPVTVDSIEERDQGEAAGVSATAEQFGGALGIAVLYSVFHGAYVDRLHERVDQSPLPDLTNVTGPSLRSALEAAEATGLHVDAIDRSLRGYVLIADGASRYGYAVTFAVVTVIATLGAVAVGRLVRRPRVTTASPPPVAPEPVPPPSPTG